VSKRRAVAERKAAPAPSSADITPKAIPLTQEQIDDELANVTLRAQDFVCRVDFNDQVRKEEADGTRLDIPETVAKYRALDDRTGMIADDELARRRARMRERGERLFAELGIEL